MKLKNKIIIFTVILAALLGGYYMYGHKNMHHSSTIQQSGAYIEEGAKIAISENYSFLYKFSEKPKIGTIIVKASVFNRDNKQTDKVNISGRYDMPSMAGHHASGMQSFKKNKKGYYLLPVNVVMPGVWEINLIISDGDQKIYEGKIRFEV